MVYSAKAITASNTKILTGPARVAIRSTGSRLGQRWGRELRPCRASSPPSRKRSASPPASAKARSPCSVRRSASALGPGPSSADHPHTPSGPSPSPPAPCCATAPGDISRRPTPLDSNCTDSPRSTTSRLRLMLQRWSGFRGPTWPAVVDLPPVALRASSVRPTTSPISRFSSAIPKPPCPRIGCVYPNSASKETEGTSALLDGAVLGEGVGIHAEGSSITLPWG